MSDRVQLKPGLAIFKSPSDSSQCATTSKPAVLRWAGEEGDFTAFLTPNGEVRYVRTADIAPPAPTGPELNPLQREFMQSLTQHRPDLAAAYGVQPGPSLPPEIAAMNVFQREYLTSLHQSRPEIAAEYIKAWAASDEGQAALAAHQQRTAEVPAQERSRVEEAQRETTATNEFMRTLFPHLADRFGGK